MPKGDAMLNRTKQILLDNGWCQRKAHDFEAGTYCIMGALEKAAHRPWDDAHYAAASRLADVVPSIKERPWRTGGDVANFNDRPGRTLEHILGLIEAALKNEPFEDPLGVEA